MIKHPLFCSRSKLAEEWYWGGETMDDAINAGLDLWGGANRPDGFWVAPSHRTTEAEASDGQEHPYTVEADKAEWIPLRNPKWNIAANNAGDPASAYWTVTDGERRFDCAVYADAVWLRDLLNML